MMPKSSHRDAVVAACLLVVGVAASGVVTAADVALIEAVRARDHARARALIEEGAHLDAPQGDGATALHWAAHQDDARAARLLLGAGANARAADDHGVTPLSLACLNGSAAMVALLLEAGADPNAGRTSGVTPLMTAARVGNIEVVRALLASGADVAATEHSRGQTALMLAVAESQTAVARVLVESGGGATTRSTNGFTPLLFAAQQGNVDIARLLISAGAAVDEAAPDGIGGDTNARALFKPDTDATALMVAIDSGHAPLAAFLIEQGADVNHGGTGRAPLHSATQQVMPEVVSALLAAGADPNVRLEKPMPLLSRYIRLDNGLMPTTLGATPFWLAASYGDVEIMRLLVDGGADPLLASAEGTTALMVAAGADYVEGQDKYGRRSFPAYYETLQRRALAAITLCLELALDINAVNDKGQTPLHGAVYTGGTLLVPYLVEWGAKMDVVNKRGQTPWMIAAQGEYRAGSFYRHEETGRVLEELGADTSLGFDLGPDFEKALDDDTSGTR